MIRTMFGLVLATAGVAIADDVKPLPQAHAHNDYYHDRPLLDALEHGFCSVEADVFLVDGNILVGHDRSELRNDRTLQRLYLEPLRQRVKNNGGRVYRDGPVFSLLIDIKSEGESTYQGLRQVLAQYADMLASVKEGQPTPGPVTVVISGNRAKQTIAADSIRHCGIDGRFADVGTRMPAHLMPMISDNWGQHFRWRGQGEMPEAERGKLRKIVKQAHEAGRRVRVWATPEEESVWEELADAGVDLINTDQLARLQSFLGSRDGRE